MACLEKEHRAPHLNIHTLALVPLGKTPRSARRAAFFWRCAHHLNFLERPYDRRSPLVSEEGVVLCALDTLDTQGPCVDPSRDPSVLCVVQEVSNLWAVKITLLA